MIEIFCVVVNSTVVYALNITCQFPMLVLKAADPTNCVTVFILTNEIVFLHDHAESQYLKLEAQEL